MLTILHLLAEEKIQEALRQGEFDNLEGAGKPLVFEDDSNVPEDLRMAYKMLRNAGCLPPDLQSEKEINTAMELLAGMEDEAERHRQIQKLNYLVMSLNARRRTRIDLEKNQLYYDKVVERVSLQKRPGQGS
jgi:hypothetical protein